MLRTSVVVVALLISARTLWEAFVDHQISTDTALLRLLIALPIAAMLLGVLRLVTSDYIRPRTDGPARNVRPGADDPAAAAESRRADGR